MPQAPYPPTRRQLDALRFVHGYQLANEGRSPTMDSIGEGLGINHRSGVQRLLLSLEERNLIRRGPRGAEGRPIELLTPVAIPTSPDGAPLYFVPLEEPAQ